MINLIPNQEKKKKVKDFYFRLVVVFFVVMGICLLIASVAILPSYLLSSVKKNLIQTKLQTQKNETLPQEDQDTLSTISTLNNKLTLVENAEKKRYLVSVKIINEILFKKMPDIKITKISYSKSGTGEMKVSLIGIAPSRDRLLFFRQALEDDVAFKSVDLPISNFVKGSDIQFNLNLIPS